MLEFGSDFHLVDGGDSHQGSLMEKYQGATYLADGRQCIEVLIRQNRWKRLWMPEYFCYNIIEYLQKNTGIDISFYTDYPGNDDKEVVSNLDFEEGDVLLRMNYFGLRSFRSTKDIPVPVIEDHSHDLVGDWAMNSDADWCIASLRKIIPIPEGGIVWSPKNNKLIFHLVQTAINNDLAQKRWRAMEEKGQYLRGIIDDKELFRSLYIETEETLDELDISLIDEKSRHYLESFDLGNWNITKKKNWEILSRLDSNTGVQVVRQESENLTPFSLVLLFDDETNRERVRKKLIESSVYPAVLWYVPDGAHDEVRSFSKRMLSIHCDARYSENDIEELYNTINTIIRND